jgi:hypothetical protein
VAATCEKNFACGGAQALLDMGGYGSVADCTKAMQAQDCANPTCPAGKTYHPDQVQKCTDETKAQSCADFASNPPASCMEVCTAAGVTPGSGGSAIGAGGSQGGGSGGGGTSSAGGASGAGGTSSAGGASGAGGTMGSGGVGGKGGTSGTGGGGGSGGSTLAACSGTIKVCGGDPTGTWDITSACIDGDLTAAANAEMAADYPDCANMFTASSVNRLTGSVTYKTGTYTYDSVMEVSQTVAYTPACVLALAGGTLSATVCSELEAGLNDEPGTTATCTYATNCTCHATIVGTSTTSGTYTVNGSTISEDTGTSYEFCVTGDTMTQREQIVGSAYGVTDLKKR